jgi:hypothetical protein
LGHSFQAENTVNYKQHIEPLTSTLKVWRGRWERFRSEGKKDTQNKVTSFDLRLGM